KCKEMGIQKEYNMYQIRLRINYVQTFLVLHWVVTLFHCAMLVGTCDPWDLIFIDVFLYIASGIFISGVLWINFNYDLVSKRIWIMTLTAVAAATIIALIDFSIGMIHLHSDDWVVRPFYDTYVILMVYIFLPIPNVYPALAVGILISGIYIIGLIIHVYLRYPHEWANLFFIRIYSETSHYVCLNVLGIFIRLLRETIVSSSFLDRHQYVMELISLRNARAKERRFLHSILPEQIAKPIQDDIRNRIKFSERNRRVPIMNFKDKFMAIQIHPEVTILYADIVNYTYLTTKLTVKELLSLLHDLYARFDVAAARYDVTRIKFLGDCYYCVAGLTNLDPYHAQNCAALGLCMIKEIREVRSLRNVDIDIRVGVHSGALFAGVIGAIKLQYDIWGVDVMIANRLEGTGTTGHIHISERTLNFMIDHPYTVLPGTEAARDDPYLIRNGIKTFLIPMRSENESNLQPVDSLQLSEKTEKEPSVEEELRTEFAKMPVGLSCRANKWIEFLRWKPRKREQERKLICPPMSFFFMHFKDPSLEYGYMHQADYIIKYTILLSWITAIGLVIREIEYSTSSELSLHLPYALLGSLTVLLFITWYKHICNWNYPENYEKYSSFSCFTFRLVEQIQNSLIVRVVIYMFIIMSYSLFVAMLVVNCNLKEYEIMSIESKVYHYYPENNMCFLPWSVNKMICLLLGITLLFTRIPFMLKVLIGLLELVIVVVIMVFQFQFVVHHSITTNPYLISEYAHCMVLLITLLMFYLMERQAEFNDRMNYLWRVELKKKQHDSLLADQSTTILLHNILPSHVVDVYISSLAKHELYYENYKMVAIMFASLKNFAMDLSHLRVLNEIITEFDRMLSYYSENFLVDKIKIVGCTYMAACGLNYMHSEDPKNPHSSRDSIFQEVMRVKKNIAMINKHSSETSESNMEVAVVLTNFALDLMRTLSLCNNSFKALRATDRAIFHADISIGISSGEVMAGVVGASQVHYDIWGNAVNMASRMDSTGVAGKIQVTEETAAILRKSGLQCDYRGMTYVKGRGVLPTFFVAIDEYFNFKYTQSSSDEESS
ncbi:hypothetical protein KR222_011030, partial [Zaprionus bogoriensis]